MRKREKERIVKRHYDNIAKWEEFERKVFSRKVKDRAEALKIWKRAMR